MFRQLMKRLAATESLPPWSMGGAIGAMIASFLAIVIGTAVSIIVLPESQYTLLLGWSVGAALVIAFVWITRRSDRYWSTLWNRASASPKETNATQNSFWYLLIGIGLAILLDLIGRGVVGQIIPNAELLNLYGYLQLGQPILGISWIFALVFMAVLQPLAEGLVFQGLLLPSLRASIAPWPGYILAALAYMMFHFVSYQLPPAANNTALIWIGLIEPLVGGLIFGAVRIYTGSTRAAILTHMAFGLFAVVKLLTLVSG